MSKLLKVRVNIEKILNLCFGTFKLSNFQISKLFQKNLKIFSEINKFFIPISFHYI